MGVYEPGTGLAVRMLTEVSPCHHHQPHPAVGPLRADLEQQTMNVTPARTGGLPHQDSEHCLVLYDAWVWRTASSPGREVDAGSQRPLLQMRKVELRNTC